MEEASTSISFHSHSQEQEQPIPEELIAQEILPWLPVKTLIRFKSVSKRWYSLISHPNFIPLHLKRSPNALFIGPFTSPSIFYFESFDPINPNFSDCIIDASDYIIKAISIAEPVPVGSCHGLVCFNLHGLHYFLSNPATRKSIRFRGPPYRDASDRDLEPLWGFGHCRGSDDYKIVLVFSRSGHWGHRVHLFSRNDHAWSSFDGVEFDRFDFPSSMEERRGVFVGDHVYWKLKFDGNVVVVGFDLGEERMKVLTMPNWDGGVVSDCKSVALCVLWGCLCLCRENFEGEIGIWAMEEYEECGSWVRRFCLPRKPEIADLRVGECEFFGFSKTHKFMLHSKEKLILVDVNRRHVEYTRVMDSPGHIVRYSPSMVSPFKAEALTKQIKECRVG